MPTGIGARGAIWIISGTLFRDEDNPEGELPEEDFSNLNKVGDGFPVPHATYKVVSWFDSEGHFQARGYVFEQNDRDPDTATYLKAIDYIEDRAGIDFFPLLDDSVEAVIEATEYTRMWE